MSDDLAAAFAELGAATIGESGASVLASRIRPAWPGARVSGPAFPVTCSAGDNLAIHVAVTLAPPGSVLLVSVGLEPERGYWGEVLTTAAEVRGIAGLVIDGGVRDVDALREHNFPVFSSMIALRGATKNRPGHVGGQVLTGDQEVEQDDWIVGDADGVAVVPRARVDEVLAAARFRAEKERHLFAELCAGRTTVELLGLDPSPVTRDG